MIKQCWSQLSKRFYRIMNWRLLKRFSGLAAKLTFSTFIIANTILAVIPESVPDWLGMNLWKLLSSWIGFLFVVAAFIYIYRKQPSELKSGADGGKKADKFIDTLDWARFENTKKMLIKAMEQTQTNRFPGIEGKEIVLTNHALGEAENCNSNSTPQEMKTPYRSMMVARFDLLKFFEPGHRRNSGSMLMVGCGLILLPHIYNFVSIPFRMACP